MGRDAKRGALPLSATQVGTNAYFAVKAFMPSATFAVFIAVAGDADALLACAQSAVVAFTAASHSPTSGPGPPDLDFLPLPIVRRGRGNRAPSARREVTDRRAS